MLESRWLHWIGPGVVALGAVGAIASTTLGVGDRPWTPPACAGQATDRIAATQDPGPPALQAMAGEAWFRLDPVLDRDGVLAGQHLALGLHGERPSRRLSLPPESFAAGPFGRVVLVGSDDGTRSFLEAIDVANGCSWSLAEESSVIRRATMDRAGTTIYETRVDRAGRADLGVWMRSVDGTAGTGRILDPLAADGRFGRTFSTEFTWDVDGRRLAVQACGEVACRTRIVSPGNDAQVTLDAPDLGPVLGFAGDRIVTYRACHGLPCAVVSTDLGTGRRDLLADDAGAAIVVATTDGARLAYETDDGTTSQLRSVGLDGLGQLDLGPLPAGLRLHTDVARSGAATRVPVGWILLAPDGRLPVDGSALRPRLRHLQDGSTVTLEEVTR